MGKRHYYLVTVDNDDPRPDATQRQGLEIARAIHNGSIRRVQVFKTTPPAATFGEIIRYDPSRTVAQQMEEMEL